MAKVNGCWANVLNDCDGGISGEHIVPVCVWAMPPSQPNKRRGRLRQTVNVRRSPETPPFQTSVENLTANVLCRHHNGATSALDSEAGRLARAIELWRGTNEERTASPLLSWALRSYAVDGPLVERWFMKAAITLAVSCRHRVGSLDADPATVTRDLVEIVFGLREVNRSAGQGLFLLARPGNNHAFAQEFGFVFFGSPEYTTGALVSFRSLQFGINFDQTFLNEQSFHGQPGLDGVIRLQPFNAVNSGSTNVEVRLQWPAGGTRTTSVSLRPIAASRLMEEIKR